MAATVVAGCAWRGSERRPMSRTSDERADKARCAGGTVPSGAGGGLRMTVLASLERQTSLASVGRLVPEAQRMTRARGERSRLHGQEGQSKNDLGRGQLKKENGAAPAVSQGPKGRARGRRPCLRDGWVEGRSF